MVLFRELAEVLQRLERTSSNTALIGTLAAFLSKLNPEEARAVAYLLRGEVAAPFAGQEIGMADRRVMRAVADAYALSERRVEKMLAATGDLGTVAEQLAHGKRGRAKTILSVFEELRSIARISGEGSQQRRCTRLSKLLSAASGVEAKYILRTVLGSHRIGVADLTFLRALAKAFTGTVKNARSAEAAYNVLPDLGEVSRRMARSGLAGIKRLMPVPGTPVRMMLASRVQILADVALHMRGEMFVECKYDGERMQIHRDNNGRMLAFSRRLENITHQYPEIISAFNKLRCLRTPSWKAKLSLLMPARIVCCHFKRSCSEGASTRYKPTSRGSPLRSSPSICCSLRIKICSTNLSQSVEDYLRAASSHRASFACQNIS